MGECEGFEVKPQRVQGQNLLWEVRVRSPPEAEKRFTRINAINALFVLFFNHWL